MSKTLWIAAAAVLAGACAQVPPEKQVINDAAAALGGRDKILAVKTLAIEGEGPSPNVGQNRMPDGELPVWKVTEYRQVLDLGNGRSRIKQLRTAQFEFAGATVQRLDQGIDGDVGYNVGPDGQMSRAGAAVAGERRIDELRHPVAVVRAALDPAAKIANLHQDGNANVVDVTTAKGDTVTLTVDSATKLPLRVSTTTDNANMGDVVVATSFSSYEDVGGLKLPKRLTTNMDKYLQFDLQVSKNAVDVEPGDLAATEAVRQRDLVAGRLRQSSQRGVRVRRPSHPLRSAAQRSAV